jgi:hypothetical protein
MRSSGGEVKNEGSQREAATNEQANNFKNKNYTTIFPTEPQSPVALKLFAWQNGSFCSTVNNPKVVSDRLIVVEYNNADHAQLPSEYKKIVKYNLDTLASQSSVFKSLAGFLHTQTGRTYSSISSYYIPAKLGTYREFIDLQPALPTNMRLKIQIPPRTWVGWDSPTVNVLSTSLVFVKHIDFIALRDQPDYVWGRGDVTRLEHMVSWRFMNLMQHFTKAKCYMNYYEFDPNNWVKAMGMAGNLPDEWWVSVKVVSLIRTFSTSPRR